MGAELLNEEEHNDNCDNDRNCVQVRVKLLKTFDRGGNRYGRCYDPVGDQECPTQDGRHDQPLAKIPSDQGVQRKDPSFSMVIRLQGDQDIF